ncbi:serpin family protein [Natronoglomus mannanivorans]|uniref:Serpin family protein n=1 Tax=Natronoglomus mannanivorans TaxID=2979990 RepID=A0AAP2YY38_9EURY|nr:serpin family protein [Halobacteria archaeon AArc-xg1-1]
MTLEPRRHHSIDRRRVLALVGALATSSTLAGCLADDDDGDGDGDDDDSDSDGNGDDSDSDNDNGDPAAADALAELARENRRFAFDFYDELAASEPGENLFCSPHSISVALAMTYAGARGDTAEQMADTLHYTLGDDLHETIEALAAELDTRSQTGGDDGDVAGDDDGDPFQLNAVNAVWGQAEYPFREAYLATLENHYGAGLREVDFVADPEGARETINEWVEAQTEDRIDELLPEGSITHLVRLVLTNAIYFRASWANQFDEAQTEDRPFTALDGSTADVPIMRQSESFPYAEVDGHQVIELPYVGDDVGMIVVLPAEGEFETLESSLDVDRFDDFTSELEPREGAIHLPTFEFDAGFALEEILSELGMPIPFDPNDADFSGIADVAETGENLFVHDVYHDASITVDEDGTEAAAATAVVIGDESAPADPFEMVVDRPFLFAIRDRPTDIVLFLGRVVDAGTAQ